MKKKLTVLLLIFAFMQISAQIFDMSANRVLTRDIGKSWEKHNPGTYFYIKIYDDRIEIKEQGDKRSIDLKKTTFVNTTTIYYKTSNWKTNENNRDRTANFKDNDGKILEISYNKENRFVELKYENRGNYSIYTWSKH